MYFVIEAQKNKEGVISNAVYNYDTVEAAKQRFHYTLSVSIGSETLDYAMCAIVDSVGVVIANESWFAPQPEPIPPEFE